MSILDTNLTVLQVNKDTIDKPFEVGYRGDHNAYKLVFSDLVGDGYSVLFWKPMAKPCIAFPLVNNEWLLGNEVLSTSGTLYCQVVKKDESNNFIKHSQVFMLSVNESAPCTQQAFEEVPPNFKIAYDEMVAITKKVNEALTSGKFNGLSAYELAVKNGFEGTEAEWIESLKYWNSPEFTKLAEQVRADKKHVDTVVADFDTKVNTANTEFDKKVANANSAFDKKVTDADTNFTGKVNKANTDLDTKVTQINSDLDAKETAINQALDTKIDGANSVIDAKVQESATSAENAKQSELKAQSIADNMQGLTNAFRIDTSEQGRVIVAEDCSNNKLNNMMVFGESWQDGEGEPSSINVKEIKSRVVDKVVLQGKNLVNIPPISKDTEHTSIECNLIGTIAISAEVFANNNNNNIWRINVRRKDGTSVNITDEDLKQKTSKSIITATFDNPITLITYRGIYISSGAYDRIMVAYGDTIQPYEPYKEPQIVTLSQPVTLRGVIVRKVRPNVVIDGKNYLSDIIVEKEGTFGIERNCYTTTTTTTTTGRYETKKGFYLKNALEESNDRADGFANSAVIDYGSAIGQDLIWLGANNTYAYILYSRFWDESLEDKGQSNFMKFIEEHPLVIVTNYKEPKFEPLPEADQQALKALKSNYPTTVVTNNDNAFMQLDYVADTKNYIDNRLSEIKTALIASKGV